MAGAPWHAVVFLPVHWWDSGHIFCGILHASAENEELGKGGEIKETGAFVVRNSFENLLCLCYLT